MLYIAQMNKPTELESIVRFSCDYSWKRDLRLNAWLAVAALVHIAQLIVLKHTPDLTPGVRTTIALTPLLPGLLYVRDWIRFVRRLDELQRRVQLEAFLFAALGALILAAVIDALNANGLAPLGCTHGLGLGGTYLVMCSLWGLGTVIANRRYR